MSDEAIYQDSDVTITATELRYRNNPYPLSSIKSVVYFKEPLDVKGLVINVIFVVAGVVCILTLKAFCAIVGVLAAGIGGFNLYGFYQDITNPTFVVAVDFRHSSETLFMKRRSADWARRVHDTLHDALQR